MIVPPQRVSVPKLPQLAPTWAQFAAQVALAPPCENPRGLPASSVTIPSDVSPPPPPSVTPLPPMVASPVPRSAPEVAPLLKLSLLAGLPPAAQPTSDAAPIIAQKRNARATR